MTHRTATVLALTLAACLAACGDERVPAPSVPPVSGAPIAGVPIAGTPIAGTPVAPVTPPPASGGPATAAPESAGLSVPPSAPSADTPPAHVPPSAPPTPTDATGAAGATPAPKAPSAPIDAGGAALGDAAGPDPKVPGEDPIVAAQARAVSEAAAAARTTGGQTPPSAQDPKKTIEEKPVSDADPKDADSKKADPKKAGSKDDKPEIIGFDVLGAFEYVAPNPEVPGSFEKSVASIPEDIRHLGGKTVTVEGYMIPLEYAPDDDGVKSFFLSRYQIGCCFGVMPRANELVEVTMEGPKWAPYVSWMPVRATGVIQVGPKEGDTATLSGIYRIHNPEVTVPEPEEVDMQSDHAR